MIRLTFSKGRVLGIALGAFIALGGATAARADSWRDCEKKIAHEQRDLDKAIARHGAAAAATGTMTAMDTATTTTTVIS